MVVGEGSVLLLAAFVLLSTFSYKAGGGGVGSIRRLRGGVAIGIPRFSTSDTCGCVRTRISFKPHAPGSGNRITYKSCLTTGLTRRKTGIVDRGTRLPTCSNALLGTHGVVKSFGPRDGGHVTLFTR